jgi:hypothetical protein
VLDVKNDPVVPCKPPRGLFRTPDFLAVLQVPRPALASPPEVM